MNRNTILIVFLALSITVIFSDAASAATNNVTMELHEITTNSNSHLILNTTVKPDNKNLTTLKLQNNTTPIKKAVASTTSKNKIYVDVTIGKDSNTGLDWENPKKTIQDGINTVEADGNVYIARGIYSENLIISKNVHLIGLDKYTTIIKGKKRGDSVIWIQKGDTISLDSLNIQDGIAKSGGGIYNYQSNLYITSCIFSNNQARATKESNHADNYGGAIYNDAGILHVNYTIFMNNIASDQDVIGGKTYHNYGEGGAVYNNKGTCQFKNCNFEGNIAHTDGDIQVYGKYNPIIVTYFNGGFGGAIYNNNGIITVNNCYFKGNIAECGGGAIYNNCGSLEITDSNFEYNSAPVTIDLVSNYDKKFAGGYGGAINNNGGSLDINNSNFKYNTAGWGGAIYNTSSKHLIVNKSTFSHNQILALDKDGNKLEIHSSSMDWQKFWETTLKVLGGIWYLKSNVGNGLLSIEQGIAQYNECTKEDISKMEGIGGAIANNGTGIFTVTNCIFTNNTAIMGGAIANTGTGNFTLYNSEFSNNFAETYGGAIYCSERPNTKITNCDFIENRALINGGALNYSGNNTKIEWPTLNVKLNNFTNNHAPEGSTFYIGVCAHTYVIIKNNNISGTNSYTILNKNKDLNKVEADDNYWYNETTPDDEDTSRWRLWGVETEEYKMHVSSEKIKIDEQDTRGCSLDPLNLKIDENMKEERKEEEIVRIPVNLIGLNSTNITSIPATD